MPRGCFGVVVVFLFSFSIAQAQNWPQWRGPNRDAKVTGFTAPKAWPKELTKKWKVTVGNADASNTSASSGTPEGARSNPGSARSPKAVTYELRRDRVARPLPNVSRP